jgi:hypothetical protein
LPATKTQKSAVHTLSLEIKLKVKKQNCVSVTSVAIIFCEAKALLLYQIKRNPLQLKQRRNKMPYRPLGKK